MIFLAVYKRECSCNARVASRAGANGDAGIAATNAHQILGKITPKGERSGRRCCGHIRTQNSIGYTRRQA